MKKYFIIVILCIIGILPSKGEIITLDFSTNSWNLPTSNYIGSTPIEYTDGSYTIKIGGDGKNGYYHQGNSLFLSENSYIEFPTFNFKITKIEVDGPLTASPSVTQNIYVNTSYASEKTTGAIGTNTYIIKNSLQTIGTTYKLKVSNADISNITQVRLYSEESFSTEPEITWSVNDFKSSGNKTISGVDFLFNKGTATYPPNVESNELRFYKFNKLTITAPENKILTKIVFNSTGSSYNIKMDADYGNYSITDGTYHFGTWIGYADKVEFTNNQAAARFTSIIVTYSDLYSRTTTVDELGTICLDKDVEEGEYSGAKFYEISYLDGNRLYFEEVTSLKSGYPYLFQATDTKIKMAVHGNVSTEGKSKNGFHGVLTDFPFNGSGSGFVDGDYFVVTGNKIVAASNESGVRANRAFIVKSEIPTSAPTSDAKKNMICLDDDSNGISSIPSSDTDADIYDLSGRKVYKPAHGIYIKEGKKIIY